MKNPLVSVLVPVYNVERYLPQCLDSLAAQTLRNIEIICINDGSTDSSLDIIKRYAFGDPRFKIINKANSGYGASMNAGLDLAMGRYIGIVESDDFVSPNAFESLVGKSMHGFLDMVKAEYYEYDGTDTRMKSFASFPYGKIFSPRRYPQVLRTTPSIWAAIYKRSMLLVNDIRFLETPGASFQDTSFTLRAWMAARRVRLVDDAFLHYRVNRDESSVKSNSKVYEICAEFDCARDFALSDSGRNQAFTANLLGQQFSTYRWNYYRIAREHRTDFVWKWADDFRAPFDSGVLEEEAFEPGDWDLMLELLSDTDGFVSKHQ